MTASATEVVQPDEVARTVFCVRPRGLAHALTPKPSAEARIQDVLDVAEFAESRARDAVAQLEKKLRVERAGDRAGLELLLKGLSSDINNRITTAIAEALRSYDEQRRANIWWRRLLRRGGS